MPSITVTGQQNGPNQIGVGLMNNDNVAYQQITLSYLYEFNGVPTNVQVYSGPIAANQALPFPTVAVPGPNTYTFQAVLFFGGQFPTFPPGGLPIVVT